jgi:hypothetical protein
LQGPNWSIPFHISIEVSDTTFGAVLGQREEGKPYAIYFIKKTGSCGIKLYGNKERIPCCCLLY